MTFVWAGLDSPLLPILVEEQNQGHQPKFRITKENFIFSVSAKERNCTASAIPCEVGALTSPQSLE